MWTDDFQAYSSIEETVERLRELYSEHFEGVYEMMPYEIVALHEEHYELIEEALDQEDLEIVEEYDASMQCGRSLSTMCISTQWYDIQDLEF